MLIKIYAIINETCHLLLRNQYYRREKCISAGAGFSYFLIE